MKLRIPYGNGEWQYGDLYLPEGKSQIPVVILIHGGFWRAKYDLHLMDPMAEDLVNRGLAVWNMEYSRVSQVGGGWPGTLLDAAHAVDFLRDLESTHSLDLEHVVVMGHSAGGHLALWLAGRHRLPADSPLYTNTAPLPFKGVISLAGVTDLELMWQVRQQDSPVVDFLGGTPSEVPARYQQASPKSLLPLSALQVLVHGTEDTNVPIELSKTYHDSAVAKGDDVVLLELPGVEHFKVIDPDSEVWPDIVDALTAMLALGT